MGKDINDGESEIRKAQRWGDVGKVDATVLEVVAEFLKMKSSEIQEERKIGGQAKDGDTEVSGKGECRGIGWGKKLGCANGGLKLIKSNSR